MLPRYCSTASRHTIAQYIYPLVHSPYPLGETRAPKGCKKVAYLQTRNRPTDLHSPLPTVFTLDNLPQYYCSLTSSQKSKSFVPNSIRHLPNLATPRSYSLSTLSPLLDEVQQVLRDMSAKSCDPHSVLPGPVQFFSDCLPHLIPTTTDTSASLQTGVFLSSRKAAIICPTY